MTAAVIIGKLLPYIIGLLAALAAWLKGHAEVQSVKKDREETKKERDDSIQKLSWELNRMKEDMNHQNLLNDDFRQQLTTMNSTITEVKTLVELLVDNKIKNGGH
jgi:small-conductance mechanosensitive channel